MWFSVLWIIDGVKAVLCIISENKMVWGFFSGFHAQNPFPEGIAKILKCVGKVLLELTQSRNDIVWGSGYPVFQFSAQ
jgi:hypothetical protein